jgi:hypothetical protein
MSEDTLAAGATTVENPAQAAVDTTKTPPVETGKPAGDLGKGITDVGKGVEEVAKAQSDKTATEQAGPWGDDWREKLAKDDAKRLERLRRFASPEALLQAQEEAQRKISEGVKPKGKPGDKATDDEWAAYRKEHNIPDKVEDYVKAIALPDKRQIGEADLPVINAFAERAIKSGVSPSDMSILVDEYYAMQEETQFQQATADTAFKKEAEATLKAEWGGDFAGNFAAMRPYFESVDPELYDNLFGGRMADGSKIGNHPAVLRFFAAKAVAENPMATVLTPGGNGLQTIQAEISQMETRMRNDRVAWHKDTAAQERYRQLITARDKLKA